MFSISPGREKGDAVNALNTQAIRTPSLGNAAVSGNAGANPARGGVIGTEFGLRVLSHYRCLPASG